MSSTYGLAADSFPFRDTGWPREAMETAQAFWAWHDALAEPVVPEIDGADRTAYFDAQYDQVVSLGDVRLVPPDVWSSVRRFAGSEKRRRLLAAQVPASRVLSEDIVRFQNRAELQEFVASRAGPHALLLGDLANATREFQRPRIEALAEGYFLYSRLLKTRDDIQSGRVYIPADEMTVNGVSVADLVESPPSEKVRKVVWRRIVWIRDAFARGMPLAGELNRGTARHLRRSVLLSLELLNQLERNGYDLAAFEPGLSRYHRIQSMIQASFGRTTWH